jgi:hypothetical protein
MSEDRFRLYTEELADEQEHGRVYRAFVRSYLKGAVVLGRYGTELGHAEEYAAQRGWRLPIVPPQAGFFDIDNPDSGLCTFIRQAMAVGFLSGQEDWLRHTKLRNEQ